MFSSLWNFDTNMFIVALTIMPALLSIPGCTGMDANAILHILWLVILDVSGRMFHQTSTGLRNRSGTRGGRTEQGTGQRAAIALCYGRIRGEGGDWPRGISPGCGSKGAIRREILIRRRLVGCIRWIPLDKVIVDEPAAHGRDRDRIVPIPVV